MVTVVSGTEKDDFTQNPKKSFPFRSLKEHSGSEI